MKMPYRSIELYIPIGTKLDVEILISDIISAILHVYPANEK